MTKYLAYAQSLTEQEVEWVSSAELADTLGLTSSTVRQDLSHLDFCGTSKRGYETTGLVCVLKDALGANVTWRMVVVGAGNLGRALAQHEDFERRDFHICGIFDNDERKIGTKVGRLKVQGMRELPQTVTRLKVEIGLIAVPAPAAQGVADLLIASRVKGLLNLALTHITAPKDVAVVDTRIAASLLELTFAIKALGETKSSKA
jgi:redox-sensing transcriptional repressor